MSDAQIYGADLSVVGALLAEPARAAMLTALWGGVALPASELAMRAGVTPSTASTHLNRLLDARWITVERHGRHRYFRLASSDIAQMLETLACVAPIAPVRSLNAHQATESLRIARSCYDHLAGELGVALTAALLAQGVLIGDGTAVHLSDHGKAFLQTHSVTLPPSSSRRAYARFCLDWSERRDHLAGALGAAILTTWVTQRWLERTTQSRALRLTPAGIEQLAAWGVPWPSHPHTS
jgi:DNA-binding transcriptional ArsR family regulator